MTRSVRNRWGWDRTGRALLASFAILCSLVLGWRAPESDRSPFNSPPTPPLLQVDLNAAPGPVLEALPRLGPVLTERVLAERERSPFVSVDDLDHRVRGIGPVTVNAVRPYVRIEPEPHSDLHSLMKP